MNVMVTDEADITGLVDWEEMYWMPFGMNTHVISRFAGYNQRGVYKKRQGRLANFSPRFNWQRTLAMCSRLFTMLQRRLTRLILVYSTMS